MSDNNKQDSVTEGELKDSVETNIIEPGLYRVVLLNDDYTTMDFVVDILIRVFNKEPMEATKIMLSVHNQGRGICGIYTYDIATSKIDAVSKLAKLNDFPLQCIYEKE